MNDFDKQGDLPINTREPGPEPTDSEGFARREADDDNAYWQPPAVEMPVEKPVNREEPFEPVDKFQRLRATARQTSNERFYYYHPQKGWQENAAPITRDYEEQDTDYRDSAAYQWDFHDYSRLDTARRKKGARRGIFVFAISLVCVLAISLFSLSIYAIMQNPPVDPTRPATAPTTPEQQLPKGEEDFSLTLTEKPAVAAQASAGGKLTIPQIAKLVSPSIVGITVYQNNRFYEPVATASGIILSADGYVITNAHVVADGTDYKVQFSDEDASDAILIGMDISTDLAVLKIEREGLVPVTFGNSDQIEVGEPVVAIGNLKGMILAGSVTHGIVSATGREVNADGYSLKLIQTDAAINPGSSGGALVNEYGHVIGITTSKIVAEGYEGISFSIPITDAKAILDDIISNGRVTGRAMIGITCNVVTAEDSMRYDVPMGLEIHEVALDSDIARNNKDVQPGDILLEVNGARVYSMLDLQKELLKHKVGDTIHMKLYRRLSLSQSTEIEVDVVLIER